LWFWHAHFGFPSGNNDLNVFDYSPLVFNVLQGAGYNVPFVVNQNEKKAHFVDTNESC
jgi:hypothetical protein